MLIHCWWVYRFVQTLWINKIRIDLPYISAIPLLGINPKDLKTHIQKGICTPMFIAALYTVARTWKQPKCPKIDDWLKKRWYIYTMEYYSAIRRGIAGSYDRSILSFLRNPRTLLVRVQIITATMENSMEVPQETKNGSII